MCFDDGRRRGSGLLFFGHLPDGLAMVAAAPGLRVPVWLRLLLPFFNFGRTVVALFFLEVVVWFFPFLYLELDP